VGAIPFVLGRIFPLDANDVGRGNAQCDPAIDPPGGRAKQLNRSAHHAFIGDIEVWLLINAKRDWRPVCSGGAGVRS